MVKRFLLLLFSVFILVPGAIAQNALPTIATFSANPSSVTVDDAESNQTEFTLAWHVINASESHRLILERYSLGEWVPVTNAGETLSLVGTRTQPVVHPLDFGPPTYRLLLVDGNDQLVDERILTIPYDIPEEATPEISLFTTSTPTVSMETLANGSARVSVSWQVTNRLPTSNLIFEQLMEDGQSVPVELPRENLWVASQGDGVVAPIPPLSGSVLRLRLRVVDVISGDVYAEHTVEVLAGGDGDAVLPTASPPPTPVQTEAPTEEPAAEVEAVAQVATPEPSPTPRNCVMSPLDVPLTGTSGDGCDVFRHPRTGAETRIVSFSSSDLTARPGRQVTLSWQIEGAQFALLEVYDPNQLAQGGFPEPAQAFYDGLPASGNHTITIPAAMNAGARFILWAANLSTEARSPSFLYDRLAYRIIDAGPSGSALTGSAEITAFIALPQTAQAGGEVTLSWNLNGADAALIEMYNLGTNALVGTFEDLPTIGSANIVIPDSFDEGARFVLWAANRNSDGTYTRITQSELEVPAA